MKYTSTEVNRMSWSNWNETMAKELNAAGFKARGLNMELGKWEDNYEPYSSDPSSPQSFIMGPVRGAKELDYLKSIGLLNNGRCPMCGQPIVGKPGRFTSGFDYDVHFQICQNCAHQGKKTSINPANNKGCMMALILLPYYLIKGMF